ncbi:MAG: hypothetical protein FJ102_23405 [Deltaproteobacteria bacterium]|nr:hypothetical protein [Deltaproteobacteria bacterium]
MVGLILACADPDLPAESLHFVRGGVLEPGEGLAGGWHYRPEAWTPGATTGGQVAPRLAECVPLARFPLGDVSRLVAAGGASPDTDLAFSPDGRRLAVGSYLGEVLLIDVATGRVSARRALGEGMARRVAWSPSGDTVYAGEQSPDAMLRALDPATLADRWTIRLAERVGGSPMPAGEDLYGIYTLPGVYGLQVLAGGDLIVAVAHSWPDESGRRQNRGQLLRVSPAGQPRATWPAEPAAVTLLHPAIHEASNRLLVPVTHSADAPAPADLPVGGVAILDLDTLAPVASMVVPPLLPYFQTAYLWNAVGIERDRILLGFGDGRVVLGTGLGEVQATLSPGAPVMVGDVPVAASVGHGFLRGDGAYFLTSGTNIPWGAAAPELRPPSPHPGENTVHATTLDGAPRWSFNGPWAVQGMSLGDDGYTLVVGAGERATDDRRDLYGALLFDLDGDERPGDERLLATCVTEGPVFFRQALSRDGVLAVAEVPYAEAGGVHGEYRVVLFR